MVERTVADGFRLSDEFFARVEPLLPKFKRSKKGGRPRLEWRPVLDGIFYVLRTGCQWKAMPPEFGSGSGVHNYFQLLVKRGLFTKLWKVVLEEYDELQGIDWKWQSMDGAMSKAPLGGEKNREKSHGSWPARSETLAAGGGSWRALVSRRQRCQHA